MSHRCPFELFDRGRRELSEFVAQTPADRFLTFKWDHALE